MAVTFKNNVVRMTADADSFGSAAMGRLKIQAVRLVTAGAAATASLKETDTNGAVLIKLAAPINYSDSSDIGFRCDTGVIFANLTGAGAELFVYLE